MNDFKLEANSNDDDFFGSLESRPGLSQVFGTVTLPQNENAPPRLQTPKLDSSVTPKGSAQTWNLVLAKLVIAYKDSGSVGKLGMALLHNSHEEYSIVLYKTKNNIMATCTLLSGDGEAGRAIYRQQTYLQFYDDTRNYWSLLFEKPTDEIEFIKMLRDTNVKVIELEDKLQPHLAKLAITESFACTRKSPHQGGVNDGSSISTASRAPSTISRMSKIGHNLPTVKSTYTKSDISDDSTDTEIVSTSLAVSTNKPTITTRNNRLLTQTPQITSTVGVYNSCNLPLQLQETQLMQMMLTENRTQNTEMRMNINKLENKVEKVLDKIVNFASSSSNIQHTPRRDEEILELEEKLLELKKENFKLRQGEINRSPNSQQNVDSFIASHEFQMQNLDLICSTHDWHDLSQELIAKSTTLHMELQQMREKNETLSTQLNEKTEKLSEQSRQLEEKQDKLEALTLQLGELNVALDKQRRVTQKLEDKMQELTQNLTEKQTKGQSETKRAVKEIMNNLYSSIVSQINAIPGEIVSSEQVISIIGKVIKYETLQTMQ